MVETDSAIAHCPVSNMFIRSGVMPVRRYLDEGLRLGLGTDVAGAPELSVITQMRLGFFQHNSRAVVAGDERPAPDPLEWIRLGTLGGAQALGLGNKIGTLEVGKQADLITLDLQMPEEWGPRFYRRLTKDETLKDIPVIAMTASSSDDRAATQALYNKVLAGKADAAEREAFRAALHLRL